MSGEQSITNGVVWYMRTATDSEILLSGLITILSTVLGMLFGILAIAGSGLFTGLLSLGLLVVGFVGFGRALNGHILWRDLD